MRKRYTDDGGWGDTKPIVSPRGQQRPIKAMYFNEGTEGRRIQDREMEINNRYYGNPPSKGLPMPKRGPNSMKKKKTPMRKPASFGHLASGAVGAALVSSGVTGGFALRKAYETYSPTYKYEKKRLDKAKEYIAQGDALTKYGLMKQIDQKSWDDAAPLRKRLDKVYGVKYYGKKYNKKYGHQLSPEMYRYDSSKDYNF